EEGAEGEERPVQGIPQGQEVQERKRREVAQPRHRDGPGTGGGQAVLRSAVHGCSSSPSASRDGPSRTPAHHCGRPASMNAPANSRPANTRLVTPTTGPKETCPRTAAEAAKSARTMRKAAA